MLAVLCLQLERARDVAGVPAASGGASFGVRGSLLPASQTSVLPTQPCHPEEINPEPFCSQGRRWQAKQSRKRRLMDDVLTLP